MVTIDIVDRVLSEPQEPKNLEPKNPGKLLLWESMGSKVLASENIEWRN